jgi:hypothetical protein
MKTQDETPERRNAIYVNFGCGYAAMGYVVAAFQAAFSTHSYRICSESSAAK